MAIKDQLGCDDGCVKWGRSRGVKAEHENGGKRWSFGLMCSSVDGMVKHTTASNTIDVKKSYCFFRLYH